MKLRLKVLGTDAKPARVLTSLLNDIDNRLFEIEGKSILALHDRFPDLPTAGIEASFQKYEKDYRDGVFSMLEIESVEYRCILLTGIVSGAAYAIVAATIGKAIEETFKGTPLDRSIRRLLLMDVKLFFINRHSESLMQAVDDLARHLRQLARERKPDDGRGSLTRILRTTSKKEKDCNVLEVEVEIIKPSDLKNYYELVNEYNSYLPEEPEDENS